MKGEISRALNYLEQNNYIICDAKYDKRYNSPFKLTDLEKEVGEEISIRISSVLDEIDTGIEETEREKFYFFYHKYVIS